jgi:hypothetical protein
VTDLTEFLLARIAEDEEDAKTSHVLGCRRFSEPYPDVCTCAQVKPTYRWNPARVLAECEAKRLIVEAHHANDDYDAGGNRFVDGCAECEGVWPCLTLRLLALPYADHPDYDGAWRP